MKLFSKKDRLDCSSKEFFSKDIINLFQQYGQQLNYDIRKGSYVWNMGPNYETNVENKIFKN